MGSESKLICVDDALEDVEDVLVLDVAMSLDEMLDTIVAKHSVLKRSLK